MLSYKDQKSAKSSPAATYHNEPAVDLSGASADVASDYTKKKYVFRLRRDVIEFMAFLPPRP